MATATGTVVALDPTPPDAATATGTVTASPPVDSGSASGVVTAYLGATATGTVTAVSPQNNTFTFRSGVWVPNSIERRVGGVWIGG